jgi:hypothetical protein
MYRKIPLLVFEIYSNIFKHVIWYFATPPWAIKFCRVTWPDNKKDPRYEDGAEGHCSTANYRWDSTKVVLISLFSQFSVEKKLGTASFFNIFFFKPGVEYEAWRKSLLRKCRPHNTAVLEGVQSCLPTAATHFNKRFLFLCGNLCKQCENLLHKDLCI